MIYRIFVERMDKAPARKLAEEIWALYKMRAQDIRVFIRYDVEGLTEDEMAEAVPTVFSEPPVDDVYYDKLELPPSYDVFGVGYLTGQYDQRADSAAQCVQLLTQKDRPLVKCATIYAISGLRGNELARVKKYLVNPVESEIVDNSMPETLAHVALVAPDVPQVEGFIHFTDEEVDRYHDQGGFAMSKEDLRYVRDYFKTEKRCPTETEVRVIDTYWSDHCRHTTFLTLLQTIMVSGNNKRAEEALSLYVNLFRELYAGRKDKYMCLMDVATIGAKALRKQGLLANQDISDEINACSLNVNAVIDGVETPYTLMFKNETHNHPTEIEPFGGAATCLGGAIRDPLAGRTYVLQSMRITGASDPTVPLEYTMPGKLPQRVITKTAAAGFSSYGNQIGLATGQVDEIYHEGYKAKRLETGFVVGGARTDMIYRAKPEEGDVIILLGGETGRDGIGGATGSSKAHDKKSVLTCGAEVQKGNALTERKLQRLFLNPEVTHLIKRCNDFGAGGVAVAIGELADGLVIDLDKVTKKYEGLSGTELAISESQERMAVVVAAEDVEKFVSLAAQENLDATPVATVTGDRHMRMTWRGKDIVCISRDFLDTNGVRQSVKAEMTENTTDYFRAPQKRAFRDAVISVMSDLNVCSKKGLSETFDSTIGAKSVYMPFGGRNQLTPVIAMAAKFTGGETDDCSVSAYGFTPKLMSKSPFTGAIYSIVGAVSKIVATGADYKDIRLSAQEYFMRLRNEKRRWGQPLAALLGALWAQMGLGLGVIGGKDSMSGSFENIDVPPTYIAFATAPSKASKLITNVWEPCEEHCAKLYLLPIKRDEYDVPDFEYLKKVYDKVREKIEAGKILHATVVENGGVAAAVMKSCFGNSNGFFFDGRYDTLFGERYGDIIIEMDQPYGLTGIEHCFIGKTQPREEGFSYNGERISYDEALEAYIAKLDPIFPMMARAEGEAPVCDSFDRQSFPNISVHTASPRVFIPAFPGTNCELDTARAFRLAGADPEILVIRNRTPQDIEESIKAIAKEIDRANIIAFPGGFSGGDEPAGSGKFIATTFRNPAIADRIMELLNKRDGLILGICNGFQALIKLGLVPYGEVRDLQDSSPTLTYNNIGRHVSTLVDIRVASVKSPWLSACSVGDVYTMPVSHGEGKLVAPKSVLNKLRSNGQIATQYADLSGRPTMQGPFNPNGSMYAIEGITSPDGRIYGKMGHAERYGENLYKNCYGNFDMKLFESGVKYFK